MPNKKLTTSQLRKFRSDVAALKSKGLVGKRVDARKQKPSRYMRQQIARFGDVLSGKAQVVHAPKARDAKEFAARFDVKGKSIVVPQSKGEHLRYSKKTGEITSRVTQNGVKVQKVYSPKAITGVEGLPSGKDVLYTLKLGKNGGQFSFDTKLGLANFLRSLSDSGWKDAIKYVEVTRGHKFEGDLEDFADEIDEDNSLSEMARDARDAEPRKAVAKRSKKR